MENNPASINKRPPVDITDPKYQVCQVEATMAMEGFVLDNEDKHDLMDIATGRKSAEELIKRDIERYT